MPIHKGLAPAGTALQRKHLLVLCRPIFACIVLIPGTVSVESVRRACSSWSETRWKCTCSMEGLQGPAPTRFLQLWYKENSRWFWKHCTSGCNSSNQQQVAKHHEILPDSALILTLLHATFLWSENSLLRWYAVGARLENFQPHFKMPKYLPNAELFRRCASAFA